MAEVLENADGLRERVHFLFRTMGCPTLQEFDRTKEMAGSSPAGNPKVFDGFLWVPKLVLHDRSVDLQLAGWFGCHDAIDVMPPRVPIEFFVPAVHGSNVERGWNPLFSLAGRRSFPLGRHPLCCTLVDHRTNKVFGVDCWRPATRVGPRDESGKGNWRDVGIALGGRAGATVVR